MKKLRAARLGYIFSLFFAMAASAILGGMIAYGTAAALILLAGGAGLLAWQCKRQLSIRHALDSDHCIRGGQVRYAVMIRNRGLVPLAWAEVKTGCSRKLTDEGKPFEISLNPFGVFKHMTEISPAHRGNYVLWVGSVRLSDPFRLTDLRGRPPGPLTLTVLPKLIPISDEWKRRLDPQGGGGFFSQNSDEPAVDSRTYRYGDSPRRIHWNLTARSRELMVRQYESIEHRRLLVLLDLSPLSDENPEAREDALIESCLSVVRYALERQIETTLVYAEGEGLRRHIGRDMRAFDEIHYASANLEFNAHIPALRLLEEAKQAQMVYLFCAGAPGGDVLSALPQDKPVELAVMGSGKAKLPDSVGTIRVTELKL